MPPVREASTKPSAATVLPAPVACSNQKRRAAPGSSALRLARRPPPRPPRPDPSRAAPRPASSSPSSSTSPEWQLLEPAAAVGAPLRRLLELGGERDQRAGQGVDLVGGQRRAVGEVRLLLGQQPLEAEHQRVVAPPLDRRLLAAGVDLGERASSALPARGARARAPIAASSPSSTKGSRANSSARFRSSPETGEASATELVSATCIRPSR